MKTCNTVCVQIFVGLPKGYRDPLDKYTEDNDILIFQRHKATEEICEFCDEYKIGVTITETQFIYPGGAEPGLIVGFSSHPVFDRTASELISLAGTLARNLGERLKQERVFVVANPTTMMFERGEDYG